MASNSPPLPNLHGQRRIYTVQHTTIRRTPGVAPAPPTAHPPTVSVILRITYVQSPGNAPRLINVQRIPSRPLTNPERFYHARITRPVPTRTRSLSPSPKNRPLGQYRQKSPLSLSPKNSPLGQHRQKKSSLWDQLKHYKHSTTRILRRGRSAVRECANRIQAAFRNSAAKWGTVALASAVAVGVAYATTNSIAYNMQPQPAYLTQWAREPTWLYADSPDQILGLHAPLWSRALQPEPVVKKQFNKMNKYWATDKASLHDVAQPSAADMEKIFNRYKHAKENYHRRPPYQEPDLDLDPQEMFNMTIPGDELPRFRAGCVCNMTLAISNQVSHALTPYWQHDPVPQSAVELESYCPCSIGAAAWRLQQGYSAKFLPPRLYKFDQAGGELARRWDLGSWYLCHRSGRRTTREDMERAEKEGWDKEYGILDTREMVQMKMGMEEGEDDVSFGEDGDF